MLKPYVIRKEFLLTLIVGGMCSLVHYMFIRPPHIEESVHYHRHVFGYSMRMCTCRRSRQPQRPRQSSAFRHWGGDLSADIYGVN